ncbi:MAG: DUF4189 domain-containing protein [Pseudomonadota bacterium]
MIRALAYPVALGFALLATPSLAEWGGVAVHAGKATYGYSAGWDSKRDAEQRAMFYCRQFAGSQSGCQVVMTTRQCGGVARGTGSNGRQLVVAEARARGTAGDKALAACQSRLSNCEFVRNFCASDN